VEVVVVGTDKMSKTIDFELAEFRETYPEE
jgi:hypothetical protein